MDDSKHSTERRMSAGTVWDEVNARSCSFCKKSVLDPNLTECPHCTNVLKFLPGPPCEYCRNNLPSIDALICTKCKKPQRKKVREKLVNEAPRGHFLQSKQTYPQVFGSSSDSVQHPLEGEKALEKQSQSLETEDDEERTVGSFIRSRKRSSSFSRKPSDGETPKSDSPVLTSLNKQAELDQQDEPSSQEKDYGSDGAPKSDSLLNKQAKLGQQDEPSSQEKKHSRAVSGVAEHSEQVKYWQKFKA